MNRVTQAMKESKGSCHVDHDTAQWVTIDTSSPHLNNAA
jgi:hypothetical protein